MNKIVFINFTIPIISFSLQIILPTVVQNLHVGVASHTIAPSKLHNNNNKKSPLHNPCTKIKW